VENNVLIKALIAMKKAIATLPGELVRSVTWDSPRTRDVQPPILHDCDWRADLLL
jgi:hypothetical protein